MKKTLAAFAILIATGASAQSNFSAKLGYDYDALAGHSGQRQELQFGLGYKLPYGTVNGVLLGDRYRFQGAAHSYDDMNGFEVGYSLPTYQLGEIGLSSRVSYGRMNQIDPAGSGFSENFAYYSAAVEGSYKIKPNLSVFAGYRLRDTPSAVSYTQNRFTGGVDYVVTPKISARIGYAHTSERGFDYNGVTTALFYKF